MLVFHPLTDQADPVCLLPPGTPGLVPHSQGCPKCRPPNGLYYKLAKTAEAQGEEKSSTTTAGTGEQH